KVSYDCWDPYDLQDQLDALNEAAEAIFMSRPTLNGLLSNIDNTARKVCTEDPNYGAALEQYYELELLVNTQDLSKLNGGEAARQAFLDMAYSFATGGAYNPGFSIPPEALGEDGGLFVIPAPGDIPADGLDLVAGSYEGALRIFPGTFAPEDFPVTIVEYRLPDDYTGGDGYSFGDYTASLVPEIWWFEASAQPIGDFEAWVCVVDDDTDPFLWYRTQIVHATDGGGVEVLERLTENSPLICGSAGPYQTAMGSSAPGWLQLANSVVRPVLREILGVKKLNAMYFAGKGLGGRTGSLSPFGPGDLLDEPEFDVSCTVSGGDGNLLVGGENLCFIGSSINIDNGNPASGTAAGSSTYAAGTEVSVVANPGTGFELVTLTGCDGDVTDPCVVTMNADRSLTATFALTAGNYDLTLSGGPEDGTILVYYTDPYGGPPGPPDQTCTYGPGAAGCSPISLAAGTTVRLIAQPGPGLTFDGWSGACEFATGNECWLAMRAPASAGATFAPLQYTLNVAFGSGQGTVTSTPAGISCTEPVPVGGGGVCTYQFAAGTAVQLNVAPAVGYTYGIWSIDGVPGTSACSRANCSVTMDQDHDVIANLNLITTNLAIALTSLNSAGGVENNAGSGVISDDQGNSCTFAEAGAGSCEFVYAGAPTSVTLTVTPDPGGAPYSSISGAGTGACDAPESGAASVSCSFTTSSGSISATVNVWRGV
ncbi:MAG: InlB B-repeat-containing protein, partial [Gemmatimonadota bacterium]